jgi:protein HOOK3
MPGYFRDMAFINMRRDLLDATRDLEQARKRMQELDRDAADRERELLRFKTDCMLRDYLDEDHLSLCEDLAANTGITTVDAIGEEQTAALASLKSSDELISDSLKTELEATRKQLAQKVFELDQMKEQLMGALVSKDKIQRRLDDAVAEGGEQSPAAQEEAQAKGRKEDAEKIEKLKTALRQKMEVSLDLGPRIDSPYMLSFLGLRSRGLQSRKGLSTPPSSASSSSSSLVVLSSVSSQKSEGEKTVKGRKSWFAKLWRKSS